MHYLVGQNFNSEMEELKEQLGDLIKDIHGYEVIETVRSGGFATVFKVKEKSTGNIFAAKAINMKGKQLTSDHMIIQEIEIFSKVSGPSILPFHGISLTNFEGEQYPTIFTRYMENGSLGEMLRKERVHKAPADWNSTKKMINIYGISKAMLYLHNNKIIHRDLKPDNILLDENYYPYLSDFGMSKIIDSTINIKTMNGGTPIFMAPELYMNNPYDSKVDVYAFGMLLYHIITTKEPFGEFKRNAFMIWHKILSDARPPFTEGFPECFKEIIQKCWAGNPNVRPTFDEIVQKIESSELILPDVNEDEFRAYKESLK